MGAISSSKASSDTPKGKHQWALVIDQSKCILKILINMVVSF